MRVYLRNGEILVGRVEAKDLVLKVQAGIDARLLPDKINLLFLHAAAGDGQTAAEAQAMAETRDGQRLLLSAADAQFHAATPWGGLDVGLGEIQRLSARREPQPVYRLTLKDGSDLSVLPQGEPPPLKSLRFGLVKPSAGVAQLWSLQTPVAAKEADQEQPAGPAGPHCRLIGDNVLAGTIESPKVNLATAGGVLGIPVSQIQTAQRNGDPQADGPIDVQLTDGRHLTGLLTNRTLAIRFHGKLWELPAQHLVGIGSGKKAVAAASATGATAPGIAAATKAGGILPAPAVVMPAPAENPRPGPLPTALPQPVGPLPADPNRPPQVEDDDPFVPPEQFMAQPKPVQPVVPPTVNDNPFGR